MPFLFCVFVLCAKSLLRNIPMKSSKSVSNKRSKPMDYTNYAYNEAVSRLKLMLAESYAPPRGGGVGSTGGLSGTSVTYMRHMNEDSIDNYLDNLSVIERPVYSDISKYLSPAQKSRLSPGFRIKPKSSFNTYTSSKENLILQMPYAGSTTTVTAPLDYYSSNKPQQQPEADGVHAPVEIFNFIEKQEDYIEQLEKESKYCRNELSNLLGKVKDVINENTYLTETARNELAALSGADKTMPTTSPSSDSDEQQLNNKKKSTTTTRNKKDTPNSVKSPRYASAPNIVYEARISELEADLMQANIDLKRFKIENEELKHKLAHIDPLVLAGAHTTPSTVANNSSTNRDIHRKQIEHLQQEKNALEGSVRQLQKLLDESKSQQYQSVSSKRYINDLVQMERAQAELEVKHLREELERQHERVRELQHEMARRIADERANAERRYNTQVDQLGGDLSSQWEQVAKLQLDLEREKRYANDLKRDLSGRNAQIEELKMELRSNRNTFLADMAQVNAEKQSLEQEITSVRLQLDRATREAKTEATRLTAEISSLRQRLDRGDADLLHSKREVLRLNDEIANLEKELAYGEMKNEIRPTKKDLDKRISDMQEKHAETINELEDMIQTQKQLMDKLTSECKILTSKLEDTTLKHNEERKHLRETNEKLLDRLKQIWTSYKELHAAHDKLQPPSMKRPMSGKFVSSSDTAESAGEEHFSARTYILNKPLSTTSRPHLVQPTPNVPLLMTTRNPLSTITSRYSASRLVQPTTFMESPPPPTTMTPHPPQPLPIPLAIHSMTTNLLTTIASTVSTIPMTKISKTNWEKVKNGVQTMALPAPATESQQETQQTPNMTILKTMVAKSTSTKTTVTQSTPLAVSQPQTYQTTAVTTRTWPPPHPLTSLAVTTMPTMVDMKVMDNNNMIQGGTMLPAMINPHTRLVSSSMEVKHSTILADKVPTIQAKEGEMATVITQQPITTSPPINTNQQQHPQWLPLKNQQQRQLQVKTTKLRRQSAVTMAPAQRNHHQQQKRQQVVTSPQQQQDPQQSPQRMLRHLPMESPRAMLTAQQRKAEINRERAVALWGQEVAVAADQSAEENPICHNSLPRPQPKSSCADWVLGNVSAASELYDPFELEFSISSPSLMRSFGSGSCTEGEFDSISEMSISPAQTAIRRIPVKQAETEELAVKGNSESELANQKKATNGE
ncbi:nucleoprotein TPR isoform X2 [Eurosta solidaginis]|uniref:nucleoprotein TPR isoform X2 n=1 Tax=Eurosta solidaginis TaxID=178769 RepID=UPI003530DD7A